jgi:hypothetical protein
LMVMILPHFVPTKIFPLRRSKDLAYEGISYEASSYPSALETFILLSLLPEDSNFPLAQAKPITEPWWILA